MEAGVVSGDLTLPAGKPGTWGNVAARHCDTLTELGSAIGEYPLFLQEEGGWTAQLPARCLDLTFLVNPFAGISRMGVHPSQHPPVDLGELRFEHGGAVLLRAVDGSTGEGVGGVEISAFRSDRISLLTQGLGGDPAAPSPFSARSREDGWGRLAGLPAGEYFLRLLPPGGRHSPRVEGPIRIAKGAELLLAGLELHRPAALQVGLDRAELDASVEHVHLLGLWDPGCNLPAVTALEASVDVKKPARFSALAPGRWQLSARGHTDTGARLELGRWELELAPGEERALHLELAGRIFHGRLLRGERPVEADLHFRPDPPDGGPVARARSDTDGGFEVGLPGPGLYTPLVFLKGMDLGPRSLSPVRFEAPEEEVSVHLPETALRGRVVDPEGRGLEAVVTAEIEISNAPASDSPPGPWSLVTASGPEGFFQLDALPAGTWALRATTLENLGTGIQRRSRPHTIQVLEDEVREGLRLVVERGRRAGGRVLRADGLPLAGARLRIEYPRPEATAFAASHAVSADSRGGFEVELSPDAPQEGTLVIDAPGRMRGTRRIRLAEDQEIVVPSEPGDVLLHPPPSGWGSGGIAGLVLVFEDGSAWALAQAASALDGSADPPLRIQAMHPGLWKLFRPPGEIEASDTRGILGASGLESPAWTGFEVLPGSSLEIELPDLPGDGGAPTRSDAWP